MSSRRSCRQAKSINVDVVKSHYALSAADLTIDGGQHGFVVGQTERSRLGDAGNDDR